MKTIEATELGQVTGGKIPLGAKIPIAFGGAAVVMALTDAWDWMRGNGANAKQRSQSVDDAQRTE